MDEKNKIQTTETELRTLLRDIIPFIYIKNTSMEKFFDICVEIAKRYDYIEKSELEIAREEFEKKEYSYRSSTLDNNKFVNSLLNLKEELEKEIKRL
jgi:glutamate formiminotransferase